MKTCFTLTCSVIGFTVLQLAASELVYRPVNPSFGGSPLNGSYLLNSAQAQNKIKDPDLEDEEEKSPLEEFNDRLQRSLLSRLTSTLSNSFVDNEGNLVPGITDTKDFKVEITDEGGGSMRITTTEKATGAVTIFVVNTNS